MGIKFSLGGTEAETAEQNRAALWLSVFLIGSILLFCIYVQLSDRIKACLRRRREALFYAQWGAANSHLQPVVSDEPLLAGQVDVLRSQPAQQLPSASKLLALSLDTTTCGDNVRLCAYADVSLDTASVTSSHDGSSSVNRGRCCCICLKMERLTPQDSPIWNILKSVNAPVPKRGVGLLVCENGLKSSDKQKANAMIQHYSRAGGNGQRAKRVRVHHPENLTPFSDAEFEAA